MSVSVRVRVRVRVRVKVRIRARARVRVSYSDYAQFRSMKWGTVPGGPMPAPPMN